MATARRAARRRSTCGSGNKGHSFSDYGIKGWCPPAKQTLTSFSMMTKGLILDLTNKIELHSMFARLQPFIPPKPQTLAFWGGSEPLCPASLTASHFGIPHAFPPAKFMAHYGSQRARLMPAKCTEHKTALLFLNLFAWRHRHHHHHHHHQ